MQRLLSQNLKQATSSISQRLTNTTDSTLLYSHHPHNAFTSLSKPTHHSQFPIPHFTLFKTHHSQSSKAHGFLSNPLLSRKILSNLLNSTKRVSSKSLNDCKVGFLKPGFARGYSGFSFNRNVGYYRGGWKSWLPRPSEDNVVLWLLLANVGVFMLWHVADQRFMIRNFMISLDNFESGRIHTLITSAFSHRDTGHIISNMIGLYFFGNAIARTFGPDYLLKLYLAGAVGGSVFYLAHHAYLSLTSKSQGIWGRDPSRTPGLGASGAVNAIMLLNIFLNPRATLYLDFIIPVPAMLLGIFLIGKDMLRIIQGDSEVSGSAHLGGVVVAAIAWYRIRKGRF